MIINRLLGYGIIPWGICHSDSNYKEITGSSHHTLLSHEHTVSIAAQWPNPFGKYLIKIRTVWWRHWGVASHLHCVSLSGVTFKWRHGPFYFPRDTVSFTLSLICAVENWRCCGRLQVMNLWWKWLGDVYAKEGDTLTFKLVLGWFSPARHKMAGNTSSHSIYIPVKLGISFVCPL